MENKTITISETNCATESVIQLIKRGMANYWKIIKKKQITDLWIFLSGKRLNNYGL